MLIGSPGGHTLSLLRALVVLALLTAGCCAQTLPAATGAPPAAATAAQAEPELPYTPSLDVTAMDRSADPCVDFYSVLVRRLAEEEPDSSGPDLVERVRQAVSGQSAVSEGTAGAGGDGERP